MTEIATMTKSKMLGQIFFDMGKVIVLARGVADEIETALFGQAGDHQVIENAAFGIEELRVADLVGLEAGDIGGNQFFHGGGSGGVIRAHKKGLAHVGDIKESCAGPGPVMFSENACRILHGHFIAGEGHQLGTQSGMLMVKDCALEGSLVHRNS
jgi:hypothetical protein